VELRDPNFVLGFSNNWYDCRDELLLRCCGDFSCAKVELLLFSNMPNVDKLLSHRFAKVSAFFCSLSSATFQWNSGGLR